MYVNRLIISHPLGKDEVNCSLNIAISSLESLSTEVLIRDTHLSHELQ